MDVGSLPKMADVLLRTPGSGLARPARRRLAALVLVLAAPLAAATAGLPLSSSSSLSLGACTTALFRAAQQNDKAVVESLLDSESERCDVGKPVRAHDGMSPLFIATYQGHASIVEVLLQRSGGDGPDQATDGGDTPLSAAANSGRADIVRLLLDWGAFASPTPGIPPLYIAAREGHVHVVRLLLDWGCDVEGAWKGRTALDAAAAGDHAAVVALLRSHEETSLQLGLGLLLKEEALRFQPSKGGPRGARSGRGGQVRRRVIITDSEAAPPQHGEIGEHIDGVGARNVVKLATGRPAADAIEEGKEAREGGEQRERKEERAGREGGAGWGGQNGVREGSDVKALVVVTVLVAFLYACVRAWWCSGRTCFRVRGGKDGKDRQA